jgi:hypothetical protein
MSIFHKQKSESESVSQGSPPWADGITPKIFDLLGRHGVSTETLDANAVRFLAVPVGTDFSKSRTNMLLRHAGLSSGSTIFVDGDLLYRGADAAMVSAFSGPTRNNWRQLRIPPTPGSADEVFARVLRLLDSPLAAEIGLNAGPVEVAGDGQQMTDEMFEAITPEMAAMAYESCFRRQLADQLAVLTTSPMPPRSALLWGRPGCGRNHLLLAATHPLFAAGAAEGVYSISGAVIAVGCVFPQELDIALMKLLDEVASLPGSVLLVQDIDLCVSGTGISLSLLCSALDRGLRMLGTVRTPEALARLGRDEALTRRLLAVEVPPANNGQTAAALEGLARNSSVEVVPPAIAAAIRLSNQDEKAQPAGALGLLGAALARALWDGRTPIGPDDLYDILKHQSPESNPKE